MAPKEDWEMDSDDEAQARKKESTKMVIPKPTDKDLARTPSLNRHGLSLPQEIKMLIYEEIGFDKDVINFWNIMQVSKEYYKSFNDETFQGIALRKGAKRKQRNKTWFQTFIHVYLSKCLGCGKETNARKRSLATFGQSPLEPRLSKVCETCYYDLKRLRTTCCHKLRNLGIELIEVKHLPHYEDNSRWGLRKLYFLNAILQPIIDKHEADKEAKKQTIIDTCAPEKRDTLEKALNGNMDGQRISRYPEALMDTLVNEMMESRGSVNFLRSKSDKLVKYLENLGSLDQEVTDEINSVSIDGVQNSDLLQLALLKLMNYRSGVRYNNDSSDMFCNLLALERVSIKTFVQCVIGEYYLAQDLRNLSGL